MISFDYDGNFTRVRDQDTPAILLNFEQHQPKRFEFDLFSRFSNNASYFCGGISLVEMTGVLDKSTGESVENFQSLFNFEEGIFSVADFTQGYTNY